MKESWSHLLKSVLGGAIAGHFAGKTSTSPQPPAPEGHRKVGCLGCVGVLIVLGLFAMALERIGCIATEKTLRGKTELALTDVTLQPDKNMAWVHFKVKNNSKWAVSAGITCEVFDTTKDHPVARNSLEVLNIPPRSESEHRVGLSLEELLRAGVSDPRDRDRCRVQLTLRWISEAGDEATKRKR